MPPTRSEGGLEHALRTLDRAIATAEHGNAREELLEEVADTVSRRMIVVIVTDEAPVDEDTERLLRRLRVQHDVLWITVRDAEPVLDHASGATRRDVDSGWNVPGFLHGDAGIVAEVRAERAAEDERRRRLLERLEVVHAELGSQETAVPELLRMLHRRADVRDLVLASSTGGSTRRCSTAAGGWRWPSGSSPRASSWSGWCSCSPVRAAPSPPPPSRRRRP